MKKRYIASNHAQFVDALRTCLGLAPLYNSDSPTAEWWHDAYLSQLARADGKTTKAVST